MKRMMTRMKEGSDLHCVVEEAVEEAEEDRFEVNHGVEEDRR